ncbi:hypothetical protein BH23ACT11_BH23ACT11_26400 [soil metagenome]
MVKKPRRDRFRNVGHGEQLDHTGARIVNAAFVQRLGEAEYGEDAGRIGFLHLVARSGASVPEGKVFTQEFHRRFLDSANLADTIRQTANAGGSIRRRVRALRKKFGQVPLDDELNRMICDAIISLDACTVVIISEDVTRSGLRTIPEARDAVRKAWLSLSGLKRQIDAASQGEEIPTWPILIQKEIRYVR